MSESIALGFGNNIDYEIVWGSEVIEELIVLYDIHSNELDVDKVINSERDLVISILAFLQLESGGERFVASSAIIERFAQNFEKQITLGGTGPRAAIAMRKFGYTSALHLVTMNDHVRRLLPPDCPYVCSSEDDALYPHLIVQFGQNVCVKANDIDIFTRQANRIIYHSDDVNITMKLNEDFSSLITDAEVFLISGFNAMQSEKLLKDRLETLLQMMANLPEDALVYYEESGFYEPKFSQLIHRTLAEHIDIVGLNEDELQAYLNRRVNLQDAVQVKDALAELQNHIPVPVLVVHSKHWAIAYGEHVTKFIKALKTGVTMATTRFCYGDNFTVSDYKKVESLPSSQIDRQFADAINNLPGDTITCVPVAKVGQSSGTTIGLGDTFVGGFLPSLLEA